MTTGIPRDAREVYLNDKGEPIAWCPRDSLGATDFMRGEFYAAQDRDRMTQLFKRAEQKTAETSEQQCVVCIDVDDPAWTELVNKLMPGFNWDEIRARGEKPVARGVVPLEPIAHVVDQCYPAAGEAPLDRVNLFVFAAGGVWRRDYA